MRQANVFVKKSRKMYRVYDLDDTIIDAAGNEWVECYTFGSNKGIRMKLSDLDVIEIDEGYDSRFHDSSMPE